MSARKISLIISHLSHYAPFIHRGCLHLWFLQFWLSSQWKQASQSWDFNLDLDQEFPLCLRWFTHPRVTQGVPLQNPEPDQYFFMDASLSSWRASWKNLHISGSWDTELQHHHIHWLEMEAVRLAVLHWGLQWQGQTLCLYTDTSTTAPQSHSDRMENATGYLKQSILCLRDPLVDMFATAYNKVASIFVSPSPDETAWVVEAFSISWDNLGFPPAPIVAKTRSKYGYP